MSSDKQDTSKEKELADDNDLEDLLNNALGDFDKPAEVGVIKPSNDEEDASAIPPSEVWDTEFLLGALKPFEANMKALFEGGVPAGDGTAPLTAEEFGSQLQRFAEEANKVFTEHTVDPDFSATIAQSLRNLSDDAGNLQTQLDPEALSSMLGDLNLGGEGANDFLPFMQNMMQSFLSKELLYPSLKDICSKYPQWIEDNKDTLPANEVENYTKQQKIMEEVCKEYEAENETDSEEDKKARFKRILALMEDMQKLGQPPKDLVGENGTLLDDNGLPFQMPANVDPSQCSLM